MCHPARQVMKHAIQHEMQHALQHGLQHALPHFPQFSTMFVRASFARGKAFQANGIRCWSRIQSSGKKSRLWKNVEILEQPGNRYSAAISLVVRASRMQLSEKQAGRLHHNRTPHHKRRHYPTVARHLIPSARQRRLNPGI